MIRKMVDNDIQAVSDAEVNAFGYTLGRVMLKTEINDNPFARYFVMEEREHFVGYIGTRIVEPFGEILNFLIIPEYQGKGLGSELFDYALNEMKAAGVKEVSLEVRSNNEVAKKLYQKKGLTISLVRKNYYPDGSDALLMIGEIR